MLVQSGITFDHIFTDCDIVATFGRGEDGQLGHGACNEVEAPKVKLCFAFKFSDRSAAGSASPPILQRRGLTCTAPPVLVAQAVKSLIDKHVESVACGAEYTLAVSEGDLYSWGVSDACYIGSVCVLTGPRASR